MKQRFSQLAVASLTLLLLATPMLGWAADSPGTSPAQWRAKFNLYANKMHKNVFPGVDLIYSGSSVRLNAQLIVQPDASLDAIRLDMTGAQQTQVGAEVQTQLPADKLAMRLLPLQIFQARKGERHELAGSFVQHEDGGVGIAVKEYNAKQPLIISLVAVFQALTPAKDSAALAKGGASTTSAAPNITATKTDELNPNDGQAIPGESIKYTVTISNTGTDATNTVYNDNVDPNTTFTPGSLKTTPLAYNQTATVLEDTPTPITLTGNDADGGNLTFATTSSPTKGSNGSITQNPPSSASLTYTPNANANDNTAPAGADGFTFKVTDSDANIDNATVTINITPVNDAPVFSCGANQTHLNTDSPNITVTTWATGIAPGPATATDETGQVLTFNVTGNTTPAIFSSTPTINPSNGNLSYTLSGTTGQSTVTFTLSDGGGTANGGTDTSTPCSFTVTVNGAPSAVADNYNTQPNTTISRSAADPDDLLDNDDRGFPTASLITFGGGTVGGSVTSNNAGATVNVSGHSLTVNADGSFSYSPATGFTGNFTFDYRITNIAGSSDATVTIAVQAMPVAVADNYNTLVNTTISRATSDPDDLLDNDNLGTPAATLTSFGGGSLGGTVTTNAAGASVVLAGGTLTVNSNGSFSLTTPTTTGSFTFNYRLTNVAGTSDALVTIEVRQAPTAAADNYNMLVNSTLTINTSDPNDLLDNDTRGFPLANVSHFGGGSLGGTVTSNLAGASVALAGGTLQVNSDGSFSLTTPTATGSFTFQYRITNVAGTSDATVTIEVRKAPTAVADNYITQVNTTISRTTAATDDLLDNDDRGFPLATLISFGGGSLGGTVTTNAAGASVSLAGGMLQVNSDGSFSLTTPTVAGSFNFQYRLSNVAGNSDATVTIEVQGPPDAIDDSPIATSVPGNAFHTALNTTLNSATDANTPALLANDNLGFPLGALASFGGGSLSGTVTSNAAGSTVTFGTGSLQVLASGEFIFTPDNNFTGLFTFQYRVTNTAGFDDATVTIAVGVRPAAVADARTATGNVRLSTATNLLSNDTGDALTVTAFDASSAQGGNVTVAANGSFTYNPPAGYEGSDSFNYTVGNGFGNGPAAAVNITVSGMIWFINNTAGVGDGRLTSPFNTLAAFQAANNGIGNNPADGDNIFIYTGSGSYTGGVTLRNNQKLIGDGSASTLATITGITLASGSDPLPVFSGTDPTIENAAGNGITLASGNTIRGLTVGNTPAANAGIIGNGIGTLTITDVSINGTGQIFSLNDGVVNATFNQLSTTSTTQTAVVLSNISSGSVTDDDAFGSSITGASGVFSVTSGTTTPVSFTYNGNVTHAGANPLVIVQNHNTGTITFQNGTLSSTGGSVNFTNADGTYNFNGTTTLSSGPRITIDGGSSGGFNFSTNTSVTNPTNVAFDLDGSNATVDYNGTLSSNTAFRLVSLTTNSGGSASFDGNLSGTGNTVGIHIASNTGGTFSFTGASKVINTSATANTAVNITSNTGVTVNFTNGGLDIDSNSGIGFNVSDGSNINVSGASNSINTTDGVAIDFDGPTLNATFASVSSASSAGAGIQLDNISGTLTMNGGSITTASGTAFDVGGVANNSGGNAVVTYAGSITNTAGDCIIIQELSGGSYTLSGDISHSAAGVGIQVSNVNNGTAATVTFSGTSKSLSSGANTAVNLTTNPNGTINFTNGGLAITTTSGAGFNATGGGTVSVTGSGNTITSTTGTALNVVSTDIGASNLNFQSLSASGGSATGIILDGTGTSGGLIVNGDGSNTTQGGNGSGGTIANKSGADGAKTTGCGIYLNNTRNVTLRRMTINGTNQNFGVYGSSVTNFVMEYCTVSGTNGTSTPNREGSVVFDNMFGSNAVTSSIISGSIEDNVRVENTTGTLTAFNLTNSTIQNNSTSSGNIGFRFATATTGVSMAGTVSNCTFQGNRTDAINVDASNGTVNITVSNNTIIRGTGGNNDGNIGINVTAANAGQVTYSVTGNKVGTPDGSTDASLLNTGINIFAGGSTCTMTGSVTENTVLNRGVGASGFGIRVVSNGSASPGSTTITADVSNNTVSNVGLDYGIVAEASGTSFSSTLNVKLTNNSVSVLSGALDCIRVQARNTSTVCARISGNTTNAGGTGFVGIYVRQANTATFNLEGGTGSLAANNPGAATTGFTGTINNVAANFCGSIP